MNPSKPSLPKLIEGYSYGDSILPKDVKVGDTFYVPPTLACSSIGGLITKMKRVNFLYTTNYMGSTLELTDRIEYLSGGFITRGTIVYPIT